MKFGYPIIYVSDVRQTMAFYEKAFGLHAKFVHESAMYGEMQAGSTVLAFAAEGLSAQNGFTIAPNRLQNASAGIEVAFVTEDVAAAYQKAVGAGAQPLTAPAQKPWGQMVAYVRDINGVLVELCSPLP